MDEYDEQDDPYLQLLAVVLDPRAAAEEIEEAVNDFDEWLERSGGLPLAERLCAKPEIIRQMMTEGHISRHLGALALGGSRAARMAVGSAELRATGWLE